MYFLKLLARKQAKPKLCTGMNQSFQLDELAGRLASASVMLSFVELYTHDSQLWMQLLMRALCV